MQKLKLRDITKMSVKCTNCDGEVIFSIKDELDDKRQVSRSYPTNFPDKCPSCGTEFKNDMTDTGLIHKIKVITKSLDSYTNMEFSLIFEEATAEEPKQP